MDIATLKQKLKQHPALKWAVHRFIMHPVRTRPNWWIRLFDFTYLKRGKGSVIYRSVRKDLPPFNHFSLGKYSVVEDFCCLNNAVGDLIIGDYTRIGLRNTLIGPAQIGNHVNLGQNVTVTGMNHNYQGVEKRIDEQGVSTMPIVIEDDVWVGANAVILPGVTLGYHCVVAAGSVVSHSVPSYSICAGSPARILKQYNFESKEWERVDHKVPNAL
ncbi:MAG: acyltransferase [Bacteroides sp.]